jgi:antitoxin (DNA-binding transcriptional repressor) of toxin-antitoxin stability system
VASLNVHQACIRRASGVHQAKTHLSKLLEVREQGNEGVIVRSGVPIARLVLA